MTSIKRKTTEKELRLAAGHIKTRDEYEAQGARYMGTIGIAAKAGYHTPAGCERLGYPVSDQEFENVEYFAMYVTCYQDQCIKRHGHSYRPCLPVFYRNTGAT